MTSKSQNLKEMQEELDSYINQFKTGYFSPLSQLARLTEETGELAREINHYYGEKQKKESELPKSVAEEIGDVLIATIIMANSLEIDLTQAFQDNMTKFNKRDKFRFERVDERIKDEQIR
ncbi:nucleotide pyrophosphohydrolase [Vagococcus carniphilus]|uniref:nucleotide pyrophosphohydrolase n=1 Tax=Vagococcus carniphilus TaxID=218144 RepID=UPI00288D165E|nr:nucleotide pyrophosphohydrolase [Vagococcus carniphilus]MDT2847592.1 nucleotide pyrophosphohydrolase [Vagococcus carniphilus]